MVVIEQFDVTKTRNCGITSSINGNNMKSETILGLHPMVYSSSDPSRAIGSIIQLRSTSTEVNGNCFSRELPECNLTVPALDHVTKHPAITS
jgi:hypothetical protein